MSAPHSQRQQLHPKLVLLPSPALVQANDGTLAVAAAARDPRAAAVVWDRFSPLARKILRRTLGPNAEVEDLLQQVFLNLFRDVGTLRDVHSLHDSVVRSTVRVCRAELRRRRLRRFLALPAPRTRQGADARPLDIGDRTPLYRLYEILNRFEPSTRIIFALRTFEGMRVSQIARALDLSVAATQRRLNRAVREVLALASRDPWLSSYVAGLAS